MCHFFKTLIMLRFYFSVSICKNRNNNAVVQAVVHQFTFINSYSAYNNHILFLYKKRKEKRRGSVACPCHITCELENQESSLDHCDIKVLTLNYYALLLLNISLKSYQKYMSTSFYIMLLLISFKNLVLCVCDYKKYIVRN